MLKRFALVILFSLSAFSFVYADTVQLKDKAAITGKILARKRDQIAIDIGYTVLVVPRNQIERIVEGEISGRADKKASPAVAAAPPEDQPGLFQSTSASLPERSVRE